MKRLWNGVIITNRPSPLNVARIDNSCVPMLNRMQSTGVCVNMDALSDFARFLAADCQRIEGEIESLVGYPVNPGSHPQVREALFKKLGVHKLLLEQMEGPRRELKFRLTKTGLVSTGKLEIERFITVHPVVRMILDHRTREKLKGTYALPLMARAILCGDGAYRVHFVLKPCATDTGRLAGEDPNCMNFPVRTELGRMIKACFVASPGCRLFEVDFSQIEMRIAAHLSGARVMCSTFHQGGDVHTETAMRVYSLPANQVHPTRHRYPMKRTGFGVLYCITGQGLAYQLNSSEAQDPQNPRVWSDADCDTLIEDWYRVYPEIRAWQEDTFTRARRYGMVWTIFGRIRLVPEVRSCHSWIRNKGLRQAANQPDQGSAADLFRLSLGELHHAYGEIRRAGVRCEGLIPVHDAIVGEADESITDDVAAMTRETMEHVAELSVPIRADAKVGRDSETSWRDLKEIAS